MGQAVGAMTPETRYKRLKELTAGAERIYLPKHVVEHFPTPHDADEDAGGQEEKAAYGPNTRVMPLLATSESKAAATRLEQRLAALHPAWHTARKSVQDDVEWVRDPLVRLSAVLSAAARSGTAALDDFGIRLIRPDQPVYPPSDGPALFNVAVVTLTGQNLSVGIPYPPKDATVADLRERCAQALYGGCSPHMIRLVAQPLGVLGDDTMSLFDAGLHLSGSLCRSFLRLRGGTTIPVTPILHRASAGASAMQPRPLLRFEFPADAPSQYWHPEFADTIYSVMSVSLVRLPPALRVRLLHPPWVLRFKPSELWTFLMVARRLGVNLGLRFLVMEWFALPPEEWETAVPGSRVEATHRQLCYEGQQIISVTFALPPSAADFAAYGATYRVETTYDTQRCQAAMLRCNADSVRDADISTSALEPEEVLGPIIPAPTADALRRFRYLDGMRSANFLCMSFTVARKDWYSNVLTVTDYAGDTDVDGDNMCRFKGATYVV